MNRRIKKFNNPYRKNFLLTYIKACLLFFLIIIILSITFIAINSIKNPKEKQVTIHRISRSEAYKRGMDIINYVWKFNSDRNGNTNSNGIELPYFLKEVKTRKVSGIPYCWGGYISLDISNQKDVHNFEDAISKGYTAGNVNSSEGYKEFTAGLDCSGFVSAVFNLPEKCSTQDLNIYFNKIDISSLKPMDIFNSPKNHTFIYIRETDDKKGIITMEATTNKYAHTKDKTVISYRSWDEIKKGINGEPYVAMRYKGIEEDAVSSFDDKNEFNNSISHPTIINLGNIYKGSVDYADDVDYFKFSINRFGTCELKMLNLPDNCKISIIDSKEKNIMIIDKAGIYKIKLDKGTYYLKAEGVDYKYNSKLQYVFYIDYLTSQD